MKHTELTIIAATHGGFIVLKKSEAGMMNTPLFAGSIGSALDFVADAMKEPTPPTDVEPS